ncbi:MAG: ribosome-associated translation inhibitor RaiA [Deltaproteobacteria bacterium]|nr:ribosome-associated translation inhibitor RaiA [Deltaproteobacteria bacterium]
MRVSVTFRHMEATEPIKEYAQDKIERIKKYFPDPITAHVVLSTERGYQHVADVNITLHNGLTLQGKEITEDMYSSIDLVMAKIERQVRKYKDRIRSHKPHAGTTIPVREMILEAESFEPRPFLDEQLAREVAEAEALAGGPTPKVIRSSKFFAKAMNVDEAVMQMNLQGQDFLVFMNEASREVNVVYKRSDGNYGLIETGKPEEGEGAIAAAKAGGDLGTRAGTRQPA